MTRHIAISETLLKQLAYIPPTIIRGVAYYPCSIQTKAGQIISCAYLVEENGYYRQWGVWPEDDEKKYCIQLSEVAAIAESPHRLPLNYAKKIYDVGESGMGYYVFTIKFKNDVEQEYLCGGSVDFINYPNGYTEKDIEKVLPNVRSKKSPFSQAPTHCWCLYSKE